VGEKFATPIERMSPSTFACCIAVHAARVRRVLRGLWIR
jgi:hypothetical protein